MEETVLGDTGEMLCGGTGEAVLAVGMTEGKDVDEAGDLSMMASK